MTAEGQWPKTIYVCPLCGHMDPNQHDRDPERPRNCIFAARGLLQMHPYQGEPGWNPEVMYEPVEVMPMGDVLTPEDARQLLGAVPWEDPESMEYTDEQANALHAKLRRRAGEGTADG